MVPSCTSAPARMSAIRSAKAVASTGSCVTYRAVAPVTAKAWRSSRNMSRRSTWSSAPSGSSNNTTRGAGCQGTGQRDPLALPAGQLVDGVAATITEPDQFQHLRHSRPLIGGGPAMHTQPEGDVAGDVQVREEGRLLEHQADAAAMSRHSREVRTRQVNCALAQRFQSCDGAQQGGLAAPAGTQESQDIARRDQERHILDGDAVAETDREVVDDEFRHGRLRAAATARSAGRLRRSQR